MDSVQPSWPAGTRVLEFFTEADAVACLVKEWQAIRPKGMKGIIWYRVPVSTDARNWGWTTLSAVMDGRKPARRLEAIAEGDNPVDVSLVNFGEADDSLDRTVIASWDDGDLVSADAHSGWTVKTEHQRALFIPQPGRRLRLSPGGQRGIGWLRYDKITRVHLQLADSQATPR